MRKAKEKAIEHIMKFDKLKSVEECLVCGFFHEAIDIAIAEKDKEIEGLKEELKENQQISDRISDLILEKDELNKLWQKRFEWLKKECDNLYHRFPKGIIWRKGKDEICDMCEEYIEKKIIEAQNKEFDKV